MFNNLPAHKILWSVTLGLTLIAAAVGVIFPDMYSNVFAKEFIPGALPQDVLTILICISSLVVTWQIKEKDVLKQIYLFGIIGSLFYLYGIFTIERVYNFLYVLYLAIFSMCFWSILFSMMSLNHQRIRSISLPSKFRFVSAGFGLVIAVLFTFLWISALIPLMQQQNRIEYLYSIYIIDLCFVMPAFFITSILSIRENGYGLFFLPTIYIVGFFDV